MRIITVEHHPTCNANYPEKVEGEAPQQLTVDRIGDGEVVYTCVDCGAFRIEQEDSE